MPRRDTFRKPNDIGEGPGAIRKEGFKGLGSKGRLVMGKKNRF